MNDIQVTAVTVKPGAVIFKRPGWRGPEFAIEVLYTLTDRRIVPTYTSATRKKDVLERVERENRSAAAGAMSCQIETNGCVGMTTTRYTIGAHGLTPQTA